MPVIETTTDLILTSNSSVAKGKVKIGTSAYDETNNRLGLRTSSPTADLSFGGETNFVVRQEREATIDEGGRDLTLQAGGAATGGTDLAGGALKLAGGIATGSGSSTVQVLVATGGGAGTDDRSPALLATFASAGLTFAGAASVALAQAAANTAGGALSVVGGAANGTDKAGGDLTLSSGASTGTGVSKVLVKTSPAGSTGAAANTLTTSLEVRGDGTVVAGHQAALLAQGATAGFLMIPAVDTGDPNGTPASIPTGQVPITFCKVTGKLAVWDGSAWKLFSPDGP